jgi:hypothetical protein
MNISLLLQLVYNVIKNEVIPNTFLYNYLFQKKYFFKITYRAPYKGLNLKFNPVDLHVDYF